MPAADTANALLDAHVAWIAARLEGPALETELARHLDAFLADARKIRLKDVIRAGDIHATVRKYAVELKLGGAMPELVGAIVRHLFALKIHDRTRLIDILPDKHFRELLDKLLEFTTLREAVIRESVNSPIFSSLVTELICQGVIAYSAQSTARAEKLPGARSALKLGKAVMARTSPDIGAALGNGVRNQVRRNTESSLRASEQHLRRAFESDEFRQMVLDVWAEHKNSSVAELRRNVDSLDVEELFVIIYEYWQDFRQTEFFSAVVNAGIDKVLAQFGDLDLASLLEEIGISRDMMLDDAMRFAPPVIRHLKKKKLLQPLIRRSLQDFYASPEVAAILEGQGAVSIEGMDAGIRRRMKSKHARP